MTFKHGVDTKVYYKQFNISTFFESYDISHSQSNPETTTFGATGRARTRIAGIVDGSISMTGFFDPTATTGPDEILEAMLGSASSGVLTIYQYGDTIGYGCYLATVFTKGYKVMGKVADATKTGQDFDATGRILGGVSQHALGAETANSSSASVDNLASSANGGRGNLHVSAISGGGTWTFKLQHAPDDSTWADAITFTAVTAVTNEAKEATGTIDEYTRANWAVAGGAGNSCTFAMAFGRY